MRASSWAAPGKHSFVRLEEEIKKDASGNLVVLHRKEMVGDQIIVKLPQGATQQAAEAMASQIGGRAGSQPFAPETWIFKLKQYLDSVPNGIQALNSSGAVLDYTEPDLILRSLRTPNDPNFNDLWHLFNRTNNDKDIRAARAWDKRTSALYNSTNRVIVAVIDSGVRYTHEDLAANIWINPRENPNDSLDNDNNGYVNDVYGIDAYGTEEFVDSNFNAKRDPDTIPGFGSNAESYTDANFNGRWDSDSDPMPATTNDDGHGTHCAGLIGAVGDNGKGVVGVAWSGVQIMALRFINGRSGSLSDAVVCMDYARLNGAKVINASFGQNGGPSATESNAISRLNTDGVVFVAAAGNDGADNNGSAPFYPASYPQTNVISVGATTSSDDLWSSSNYGSSAVDLMAPGVSITSTRHDNDQAYGAGSGTSYAAPIVSGAVALRISEYPSESFTDLLNHFKNPAGFAVDQIPGLANKCVTSGRLNLSKVVGPADVNTLPPALVWHRPDHLEGLIPSAMRTPSTITLSNDVTIYSGLRKFNNTNGVNTNGLVNQTGGWLFYRTSSAVAWTSNALAWHTNNGDYQFWKATIPAVPARTFQYYLQLDFDSGARTTYSHFANNAEGFTTTTNQATAQSSAYAFTVPKATATVTISSTNQTYNGSARPVSISTTPSGLSNTVTYNGSSSAPINAGSYPVVAVINDSNYEGSATNTLSIAKAASTILSVPTASTITYGQTLASSSLTGGSSTPTGTFTFTAPTTTPSAGVATHGVTFTPSDITNYNNATNAVSVTVNKAPTIISIAPTASPIRLGQTLANSIMSGGVASVPGIFSFTLPDTAPSLGTSSQGVSFMPSDSANYLSAVTSTLVTISGVENPTGDSDGDGTPNLLEHALAEISNGAGNSGSSGQITTQSVEASGQTNTALTLTAIIRTNDPSLIYTPEATLNLGPSTSWSSSGFTLNTNNQTDVPAGFQRREYQFNAGTNTRAFLKLTVEQK